MSSLSEPGAWNAFNMAGRLFSDYVYSRARNDVGRFAANLLYDWFLSPIIHGGYYSISGEAESNIFSFVGFGRHPRLIFMRAPLMPSLEDLRFPGAPVRRPSWMAV